MAKKNTHINIWQKLINLGVEPGLKPSYTQAIRSSNIISYILFLIFSGLLLWSLQSQNLLGALSFMLCAVSVLAVIIFNGLKQTVSSRLFLAVLTPFTVVAPFLFMSFSKTPELQSSKFIFLAFCVLPSVVFHIKKEQNLLASSSVVNIITAIAFQLFVINQLELNTHQLSGFSFVLSSVFVSIVSIALTFKGYKNQSKLKELNEALILKNTQLISKQETVKSKAELSVKELIELKTRNKILAEQSQVMLQLTKSNFVQNGIISGALDDVVRTVALSLNISRASVWEWSEKSFDCVRVFSKNPNSFYQGFSIEKAKLGSFKKAIENQQLIISSEFFQDDTLQPFYDNKIFDRSIKSIVSAPYYLNGKVKGVLICEQAEIPKDWSGEDLNFIRVASDVLSIANASYRIRLEAESFKKQNEEILLKNQFIESQQEQILSKNKSLEETKKKLVESLNELKETEAALSVKESETRGVLEAINDHNLVVEYDLRGDILWMNDRTRELTQISQKDAAKMYRYSIKSLLLRSNHFSHLEYDNFWSSMNKGLSRKYELKLSLPGNELWVMATFLPIRREDKNIEKILVIAHDISTVKNQQIYIENQNKRLKEQRKEISKINNTLELRVKERTEKLEEQNQQLTEYAFINAHLLRAPVCNIMGLIDLLKSISTDEEQKEIVDFLDSSTKELDEMVLKINRAIKKGYYDDPQLIAEVEHWKSKKAMRDAITQN